MTHSELIPINDLRRETEAFRDQIDVAISRVLNSGWFVLGPENELLENELAECFGTSFCATVGNGTDALEIGLSALGVGPGDYVVTVANAGGYATTSIAKLGAVPVYCDIEPDTLLVSGRTFRASLNGLDKAPAAVVVTHLFGAAAPVDEIVAIAQPLGISVLEDCAQSISARVSGGIVGSFGDVSTTSFYPTKNLGALGDGGAVFTKSSELRDQIVAKRQYGWSRKYVTDVPGGQNSRLDEIQAAVLRQKLALLPDLTSRRQRIHAEYQKATDLLVNEAGENFVAHLAVLLSPERDRAQAHFKSRRVATEIHYPVPDYAQRVVVPGMRETTLTATDQAADQVLTIPLFPFMHDDEVARVCSALEGL